MKIREIEVNSIKSEGDLTLYDSDGNPRIVIQQNGVKIFGNKTVFEGQTFDLDIPEDTEDAIEKLNTRSTVYSIVSRGTGSDYSVEAGIYNSLTGDHIFTTKTNPAASQGYNVAVMDRYSRKWISFATYDIETTAALSDTMANALNALDNTVIVFVFTIGDAEANRSANLKTAIVRCGGSYGIFDNDNFATNAAYMLVGIPDLNEGSGIERYNDDTGSDDNWIDNSITETNGAIDNGSVTFRDAVIKSAYIEDLAVTNAKINDLSASKITAGTITAADIYLKDSKFELDGNAQLINLSDGAYDRVKIGKIGSDYGVVIKNSAGNDIISLTGAGAVFDVKSPSVTIRKNYIYTGSWVAESGESYIFGFDNNGTPDPDIDGYIIYDGSKISIPKNPGATGITVRTGASAYVGSTNKGYILFDTRALTTGNQWTIDSSTVQACAFCIKIGSQWKYDNNSSWVNFAPNAYTVCIGTMTAVSDNVTEAEVWTQAVSLGSLGGISTSDGKAIEQIVTNYQTSGDNTIDTSSYETLIAAPSITTVGGDVLVKVWGTCYCNIYPQATDVLVLALHRDSTLLVAKENIYFADGGDFKDYVIIYKDSPSSGSYTYSLKGKRASGTTYSFYSSICYIEAQELSVD